jgi:hypothetical protein
MDTLRYFGERLPRYSTSCALVAIDTPTGTWRAPSALPT